MKKVYIGIDNGTSGSIGILEEGELPFFFQTPTVFVQDYTKAKKNVSRLDAPTLRGLLLNYKREGCRVFCLIERPMVNPQRFTASCTALRCHEATLCVIETLGFAYEFVDSKEWQKALLPQGTTGDDLKKMSLQVGNRLFPEWKGEGHPDRDGLLIAEHARRKNY